MGSISLKTLYNDGHGGAAITLSMNLVQVVVDGKGRRWLRLRSCYPLMRPLCQIRRRLPQCYAAELYYLLPVTSVA